MNLDFDGCYRAVSSRDTRFDGRFYTAVTSTGIYCRPSCPARTPARRNVRFYPHAAAAERAGFRACRRCRPEVSPAAPDWDVRADLVRRGLRLIADGVVDAEGIGGLAGRLCVSERQLRRSFVAELGAGPLAVARTRRAQLARQLLEDSDLSATRIAFAAGFASVRQFNETVRAVYGRPPTALRTGAGATNGAVRLRLRYRPPLAAEDLLAFLRARALPGVEEVDATTYRRTVASGDGDGVLELEPRPDAGVVELRLHAPDLRGLPGLVTRARHLLDLDADVTAAETVLRADPLLAPLVAARPGLRVAGAFDGFETAVRIVLGQQVSVAAARTLAGRLVRRCGDRTATPDGTLTHRFPSAEAVAAADLRGLGLPGTRAATVTTLARAVASGDLDLDGGADAAAASAALARLPGVGPWTVAWVALRVLRDPDAYPAGDLGLRHSLEAAGEPAAPGTRAAAWHPWRAYGAMHLWTELADDKDRT